MRKRAFKRKFIFSIVIIFFIIAISFIYLEIVVNPIILNIAEAQVDSLGTTAISDAIYEVISDEKINYTDLVNITYDNDNTVASIVANMEKLNHLAREVSTRAQILLDEIGNRSVKVPLGAFSGLEAFAQYGPKVTLSLMPIGSVITTFDSVFETAGINQTKHSIYVDVNTTISVVLPTSTKKIAFVTSALVCECVIVGKVPDISYL